MRFQGLQVQVVVGNEVLSELSTSFHTSQWQKSMIIRPGHGSQTLKILLRDDTSKVVDFHDLRAEIVILVGGQIAHRTKKCILLQDVSEYEFQCCLQPRDQFPVVSTMDQDAFVDYAMTHASTGSDVEIFYRRYHRAYNSSVPFSKQPEAAEHRTASLDDTGATLCFEDSQLAELETYRFSYDCTATTEATKQNSMEPVAASTRCQSGTLTGYSMLPRRYSRL